MVAQLDFTFVRMAPGRAASRLIGYSLFEGRPATTAGRWWNPIVFSNLRVGATRKGHQVDRPVFIVGMGRSGTTLLGRVLAAHPDVGFLNEPKAMWHVVREDEDIIGSYAGDRPGRLYLGADDAPDDVKRRAHAVFAWYCQLSRSKRVVDKYPELIFRHQFVRAIFPDARLLIAVRAPWSTLTSVARWSKGHAVSDSDWWGVRDRKWRTLWEQGVVQRAANADLVELELANERDHYVRAAVEWVITMREAASLAVTDPMARLVRYEEFVQAPRDAIRAILAFSGLTADSRTETYAEAIVSGEGTQGNGSESTSSLAPALENAVESTWKQLTLIGQATDDADRGDSGPAAG